MNYNLIDKAKALFLQLKFISYVVRKCCRSKHAIYGTSSVATDESCLQNEFFDTPTFLRLNKKQTMSAPAWRKIKK